MADHFSKVAAKRQVPSKLLRELSSGQFSADGPLTDPAIKGQAVNAVQACADIRPFLVALIEHGEDPMQVMGARFLLAFQDSLKSNLLQQLSHDPDAVRIAKKKRVPMAIVPQIGKLS
jgi:hypothetical protein